MRLRRVLILAVSFLFLSTSVFAGAALADDEYSADGVTVSDIRVSPSALDGAGQVSVTVKVAVDASRADGGLDNVRVQGAGVSSDTVQEISIGGESDLRFTLSLSASQLGAPVGLTLQWDGASGGLPFEVTVASSAPAQPRISFTRTIDKSYVAKGDSLTLVYNIDNTGSADITGVTVTDDGIPGMSLTRSSLKAGSSAALTYTYSPDADFTSLPRISYTAGGKSYTQTCTAKTVPLKTMELEALLEASPETVNSGGDVTLLCTLTNSGNVKLTNVTISEKTLGSKLFPAATLDKGATKQFSRKVTLTKTTSFQYEISAKDESGNPVTFQSNALAVTVASAGGQYDLAVSATPDVLQMSEPGRVTFNVIVSNNGADAVANASVTDQNGNVLKQFASLPIGDSSFVYTKDIGATAQFNFCLSAPADDGTTYQVFSGPVEIIVAGPSATVAATVQTSPAPESPESTETAAEGTAGKMSTLITALLVVGFLIIVTIFVLVMMVASDRRKRGGKKR